MSYNLADLPKDEMDKINVDLAAGGVVFIECYNQQVVAEMIEREQPEYLRELLTYFRAMKGKLGKIEPEQTK